MPLLLSAFLWIGPDEPDDLAGDELRVEAEDRRHPGERLPLVRGRPDVPADQVVQQERHEHHRSPGVVVLGEEPEEEPHVRVDVSGWQGDVEKANDDCLFDLIASLQCWLACIGRMLD